jgi:hypothetical protein
MKIMKGEKFMLKTVEVLLNIASYGIMAIICVVIIRIGLKICGIEIFGDKK